MQSKLLRNPRAHRAAPPSNAASPGFTLVEMLVAVALTVLMMSLFAEVFTIATGTMSRQKGLTENDQRARMLMTLIKGDLEKRTFRTMKPFTVGDPDTTGSRDGYLYISENNAANDTDDVLQFTVKTTQASVKSAAQDPLYGRTVSLPIAGTNQPENDDGDTTNNRSVSPIAEVSYFLRNGRLYRRTLLIRVPADDAYDPQPTMSAGPYSGNFLSDFDSSAFFDYGNNRPKFNAVGGVGSFSQTLNNTTANLESLGFPQYRFGHGPVSGLPVEFLNGSYIGRFTQEETSNSNFGYPGRGGAGADGILGNADDPQTSPNANPYTRDYTQAAIPTLNSDGAVSEYAGGSRQSVDLLLSNVHAFDVKVWDPKVAIYSGAVTDYGPDGAPGIRTVDDDADTTFDNNSEVGWPGSDDGTWMDLGHKAPSGSFRLTANRNYGADGQPGAAGVDDDGANGTDDAGEIGYTGTDDYGNRFDTWHPGISTTTPYRIFIREPGSIGTWAASTAYAAGTVVFQPNSTYRLAYKCTTGGTSGAASPFLNTNTAGSTITDGTAIWTAVDNTQSLKAIQIRIRYYDISSALMRELTIVQALAP
jgi:type II secretory pathway component PulJ